MAFNTPVDNAVGLQLTSPYTAGSGSLVLKTGQGAHFSTFPTIVTVITNGTYNTGAGEVLCEYIVTGKSNDTLTGVSAVGGFADQDFSANDYVECRVSTKFYTDVTTALSTSIATVATEATLPNSRKLVQGANINFVDGGPGSTLTIASSGGGTPGGSNTQVQFNNSSAFGGTANLIISATGTPNTPAIADPSTPIQGDLWLSSSSLNLVHCRIVDGSSNRFLVREDGTFFSCGACTALSSFTASASLLQSPASVKGSLTIPANVLNTVGQCVEFVFGGWISCTNASPTITLELLLGGIVIATSGATTVFASTALTEGLFYSGYLLPIQIWVVSTGSSGTVNGFGSAGVQHSAGGIAGVFLSASVAGLYAPVTINMTQANAIDFQIAYSASNASNAAQITTAQARIRG
jgi:hypothetical protein